MSMGCGPNLVGGNFNGPISRAADLCDPSGESDYGGACRPWVGRPDAAPPTTGTKAVGTDGSAMGTSAAPETVRAAAAARSPATVF